MLRLKIVTAGDFAAIWNDNPLSPLSFPQVQRMPAGANWNIPRAFLDMVTKNGSQRRLGISKRAYGCLAKTRRRYIFPIR
jgi:hypothetical protein